MPENQMHLAQVRATMLEAGCKPNTWLKSKSMSLLLPSLSPGVGGADGLLQSLLLVGPVKHIFLPLSTGSVARPLLLFMLNKYKCQF